MEILDHQVDKLSIALDSSDVLYLKISYHPYSFAIISEIHQTMITIRQFIS